MRTDELVFLLSLPPGSRVLGSVIDGVTFPPLIGGSCALPAVVFHNLRLGASVLSCSLVALNVSF